jgi:hypothetical protein
VIVMTKRKPRPPIRYERPYDGTLKIVTSPFSISPRRGPGRPPGPSPRSLANAEDAADYALRQQAKRPHVKESPLVDEAAAKFHVSPPRVRKALKALKALKNK